jgi:hypothetical protein
MNVDPPASVNPMTGDPETPIDALAAPAENGETLLWPRKPPLVTLAETNRRLRKSYAFQLLDRPLPELLEERLQSPPIIMAGHQPSFIHPGVWAKNIVASKLAAIMGGQARFLIVDSDAVPQCTLTWPETTDDYCRVSGAPGPSWTAGRSYEQLPAAPDSAWRAFFDRLPARWRSDASSPIATFLRVFIEGSPAPDYVSRWTSGITAVERQLDVASPRYIRDSQLWSNQPGLAGRAASIFTAHILRHADQFLATYNAALAAYRRRRGIRGRQHPIPDLARDGDRMETPFWALGPTQPRRRLFVSRPHAGAIQLWAATESICTLSRADLASRPGETLAESLANWQIRPRALALTMFARLLVCDLFIHGIGGAKYDQITDDIIRGFFHVEPPAYACVSATCRLPLRTYPVTDADRLACARRLRDLSYNPQRYVAELPQPDNMPSGSTGITEVIAERANAIAESDRLRSATGGPLADRATRKAAFTRIRQANTALLRLMPGALEHTRHRLAEIAAQLAHNRTAANREWFFAFYPTADLLRLRNAVGPARK